MAEITFEDFEKVDIRVGKIIEVTEFERAKFPTYKMKIDLGGELGVKQTSARFKETYTIEELLGSQCLAVVNFPPKNIAGFISEVLVVGATMENGKITLLRPDKEAKLGTRLY